MVVKPCEASVFADCDVIFSGLDSSVAGEIEEAFFEANLPVLSNARNHRYTPTVPLVVPLVNADHLSLIPEQRKAKGLDKGFLLTNANCSTTGLVVVLKALQQAFGTLAQVNVVTLQAISGAGYPGCSALDMLDNVVPYISGEEEKMERETGKILGSICPEGQTIQEATMPQVSATCTRVPVTDGHTEIVSIRFALDGGEGGRSEPPSVEEVKRALASFRPAHFPTDPSQVPSAPKAAIEVLEEPDRPQPRLDRETGRGFSVSVGRIRPCSLFHIKLVLLSHNTVLGAAGSSVLNAELAVSKGYL